MELALRLGVGGGAELTLHQPGHDFEHRGRMVLGFTLIRGAYDAKSRHVAAHLHERLTVQVAVAIGAGERQKLPPAEPDEKNIEFPLHGIGILRRRSRGQVSQRQTERLLVAFHLCELVQPSPVWRSRKQRREQSIKRSARLFLGSRISASAGPRHLMEPSGNVNRIRCGNGGAIS